MTLARRLTAAAALLPLAAFAQKPASAKKPSIEAQVDAITRSAILIDTHNDITSQTVAGYDIAMPNKQGQTDLPRMKGYLGAEFFAVYVGANYTNGNHSANRALQMIDTVKHDIVEKHPNDFVFATTADDIVRAHAQHKIAALMGIEGGHAIEDSPRLLRDFYALGIRYMTLTHTNTNSWADSQGDIDNPKVEHHNGLTPLGKEIVHEMNRLGMMVDISHVADKTFWDALETSTAPLIASHSSCRALAPHTRNMTDDMIKAMAAKGGVIQINFDCGYLSERYDSESKPLMAKMMAAFNKLQALPPEQQRAEMAKMRDEFRSQLKPATLEDVVAHIDHAVKLAGIDHVGIGTDFDGVPCVPEELDSYAKFPNLTRALLEKGYSATDIKKIYGGNTLALMRAVEAEARKLQAAENTAKK